MLDEPLNQWPVGTSPFGSTVPLALNARAGFGGVGNEGELLYQSHLRVADDTVKEADFRGGRREHHRVFRSGFAPQR